MDQYTQAVIASLENHVAVSSVNFKQHASATVAEICAWETKHSPYRLPDDLKAFLAVSNGFTLLWDVVINGNATPLGSMCINSLKELVPLELDHWPDDDPTLEYGQIIVGNGPPVPKKKGKKSAHNSVAKSSENLIPDSKLKPLHVTRAFDLDAKACGGRVALLFIHGRNAPEVWFQDLSCSWSYISAGFSDYFRLMLTHVGLPNWQYTFTPSGLDPAARMWLRFLSPGKLAIDDEDDGLTTKRGSRRRVKSRAGNAAVAPDATKPVGTKARLGSPAPRPRRKSGSKASVPRSLTDSHDSHGSLHPPPPNPARGTDLPAGSTRPSSAPVRASMQPRFR